MAGRPRCALDELGSPSAVYSAFASESARSDVVFLVVIAGCCDFLLTALLVLLPVPARRVCRSPIEPFILSSSLRSRTFRPLAVLALTDGLPAAAVEAAECVFLVDVPLADVVFLLPLPIVS